MESTRQTILSRIDVFIRTQGMSEREFGLQAVRDHKFIPRLRRGFGVTLTSIERAEHFMTSASVKPAESNTKAA